MLSRDQIQKLLPTGQLRDLSRRHDGNWRIDNFIDLRHRNCQRLTARFSFANNDIIGRTLNEQAGKILSVISNNGNCLETLANLTGGIKYRLNKV